MIANDLTLMKISTMPWGWRHPHRLLWALLGTSL